MIPVLSNAPGQPFKTKNFSLHVGYTANRSPGQQQENSYHNLQLNLGAPITLSWEKRPPQICDTGNIVALSNPGEKEFLLGSDEYHIMEIDFAPGFMDNTLGQKDFRFRTLYNFYDPFIRDMAVRIYESICCNTLSEKLYMDSLGVACAIHLGTNYSTNNRRIFAPKGKLSSYQLKNLIEFVRSGIHNVITLEALAGSIHLSVFHFARLFKNTLGVSPYQFVLQMKIEHAKKYIKGKEPIGDVAEKLGFTDSAHFCNAFKKFTGYSPLQYNIRG